MSGYQVVRVYSLRLWVENGEVLVRAPVSA